MNSICNVRYQLSFSNKGFTLTEVITVIAIMAIITGFALPPFVGWLQNMKYKQAASEIANYLKTARSSAIALNKQHSVDFIKADKSYQFTRYSSTTREWVSFGQKEVLRDSLNLGLYGNNNDTLEIRFNINGSTFDNYSIQVKESDINKYIVTVQRSGRIRMRKSN
ncbi:MAG: prepilin-type N-terminal cleavage/methylation domain-containing protein [Desulfuromonadaceae bacterium]|nr:prepilin-type N-terminal cleavage/methylation domain-containing protein [Desulfuromonadaceae bacterium]MDD2856579.1 prepilin-type N-terminal cleavage/methylation domain-containing protein [Desulfuromonadaceae bacterium]